MIFVGTDAFEGNASTYLSPMLKSAGGGKVQVMTYASQGASKGVLMNYNYSTSYEGWNATALAASVKGVFGYAESSIASGCQGWVTIRGPVDNAQAAAASFTGSLGHGVYFTATGIGATTTTYVGAPSQVAILREYVNESTTANIYIVGNMYAEV